MDLAAATACKVDSDAVVHQESKDWTYIAFVRCVLTASVVWCVFYYFGRHVAYGGDDSSVLVPLFQDGLMQHLQRHTRPLEYFFALLSVRTGFPVWIAVSYLAYVGSSVGALTLLRIADRNQQPHFWKILVCASSPLAAQAYFQVDTVSQALGNVFSLAIVILTLRSLRTGQASDIRSQAWAVALLALLCILSKESTYGTVLASATILLVRHRRLVLTPACIALLLVVGAVLGRGLYRYGMAGGSSSELHLDPLYWVFAIVYSACVAVAPIPTSITLTGAFLTEPVLAAVVAVGAAVALAGSIMLGVSLLKDRTRRKSAAERGHDNHLLLAMLAIVSLVPTLFFGAAELYASPMVPMLQVLLMISIPARERFYPALGYACSVLWIVASTINIVYYSIATGYSTAGQSPSMIDRVLYEPIERAVANESRIYSIYYSKLYSDQQRSFKGGRVCKIDPRQPDVCLPESIGSGVPQRL